MCVIFLLKYGSKLQEQTQTIERKVVKSIKRKDRFLSCGISLLGILSLHKNIMMKYLGRVYFSS